MKLVTCGKCQQTVAMNDAFRLAGQTLCGECLEEALSGNTSNSNLESHGVERLVDPSLCSVCGKEFPLPLEGRLSGLPACPECEEKARRRAFPAWVKLSLAAVLALTVVALVRYLPLLQARMEFTQSVEAFFREGDLDRAVELSASAAERVPDYKDYLAIADLFTAIALIRDDNCQGALNLLKPHQDYLGDLDVYRYWLLRAEGAVAFDDQQYETFLAKALQAHKLTGDDFDAYSVASAYACRYAVTGEAEHKTQALTWLAKFSAIADADPEELALFTQRIHHRLVTREIIDRQEFLQRFPNGYQGRAQ